MKIYNLSSQVRDADVRRMVASCNAQMRQHFCPAWGFTATDMHFEPSKLLPKNSVEPFFALINRDEVPNALGYHTENANGQQVGFIMTDPVFEGGGSAMAGPLSVSGVLSHEFLEWKLNPRVNVWAEAPDGYEYPQEACDAVQGDCYEFVGCTVSNFVTPAWFDDLPPLGSKFDHLGVLSTPFTIAKDGYSMRRTPGGKIDQVGMRLAWKSDVLVLPRSQMLK